MHYTVPDDRVRYFRNVGVHIGIGMFGAFSVYDPDARSLHDSITIVSSNVLTQPSHA